MSEGLKLTKIQAYDSGFSHDLEVCIAGTVECVSECTSHHLWPNN